MEKLFTISEISKISGVSAHTLRYYDKANILKPKKEMKITVIGTIQQARLVY